MAVRDYRDLIAWQKAMDLVEAVYQHTKRFPREELYGLTSQIRRAAISVPSNIAEGEGRDSKKDFYRFLSIANGSLREVQTQLMIAQRLDYITSEEVQPTLSLATEVSKILHGLMKRQNISPEN